MPHRLVLAAVAASTVILAVPPALAERCRVVDGRLVSRVVDTFSNGKPCTSPLAVCTEGRFTGDLKGRFRFTSQTLQFYNTQDPGAPPDIASLTGFFELSPRKVCKGTLTLTDTSAYSFGPDGSYSAIETITSGTGTCEDVTGRIRIEGVFVDGCVDCNYRGEVCGIPEDDDDDTDG